MVCDSMRSTTDSSRPGVYRPSFLFSRGDTNVFKYWVLDTRFIFSKYDNSKRYQTICRYH